MIETESIHGIYAIISCVGPKECIDNKCVVIVDPTKCVDRKHDWLG